MYDGLWKNEDRPFREYQPGGTSDVQELPTWVAGEIEDQTAWSGLIHRSRVGRVCLAATHGAIEAGAHPNTGGRNTEGTTFRHRPGQPSWRQCDLPTDRDAGYTNRDDQRQLRNESIN